MATYVNDLRLTELATGEGSGTWGVTTNLNLELIGEALGYGTQDCFASDADATTTVADGASDPARAMYFKVTSSATLTATRTLTIAPNTVSRVMLIENATTGSQSIAISQGSGGNVTIASGQTKMVYLDGAGATAAVVDALADLELGTITVADLTATTADINGGTIDGVTIGGSSAGAGSFTTLTTSGAVTHNGGTANGVAYLNGSKVLTTGSALQFDGTVLTLGENGSFTSAFSGNGLVVSKTNVGSVNAIRSISDTSDILLINDSASGFANTAFYASGAEQMRLTSTGLGIGTTSPNATLKVQGPVDTATISTSSTPAARINNGGAISNWIGANGYNYGYIQSIQDDGTNNLKPLALQPLGGNVGIGTSSPSYNLQVASAATAATAFFSSTATPAYNSSGYNGSSARLQLVGGSASGAQTGINLSQGGAFELFIGGVQESGGAAAFVVQGYNGSAYSERFRIDSSGNVTIGSTDAGNAGTLNLSVGLAGTTTGGVQLWSPTTGTHYVQFGDGTTGGDPYRGAVGYNHTADALLMLTAGSERARLDASGNLLVGTTSGSFGSRITALSTTSYLFESRRTGTGSEGQMVFVNGNGAVGSIFTNGSATAYNTSSDARLKENIADAEDAGAKVDAIQVRQFDWKADGAHQDYGMIAQELMTVAPEAVSGDPESDDMMGVDYSKLVPMLVKEIQSLRARVHALEGK